MENSDLKAELKHIKTRFGQVVKYRRLKAELGQEALADKTGIHRTHLSLLERGKHLPNLEVIFRLAKALDVKLAVLMAEVESEEPLPKPPDRPKGRPAKPKTSRRSSDKRK